MTQEKRNLVVFGYGLALIILFFIWRHSAKGELSWVSWAFMAAAIVLTLVTALDYRRLKPFYTRWMIVAHFIGIIITTLLLSVLFLCIFGIAGLILRLLKKDPLDRTWYKEKVTYWIKREEPSIGNERYLKQF